MKDVERILLGLALNRVERAVDDAFGNGFLALIHQAVHEFREHHVAIFGVWSNFAFLCTVAAGHSRFLRLFFSRSRLVLPAGRIRLSECHFGLFAPYTERRCLRSLTPWVSSTPRRM